MLREAPRHSGNEIKSPLYFQHGIADSADAFIMNTPEKAPVFIAARAGYDVWLGNMRGNKYSRTHLTFDPDLDAKDFFNYSFAEVANYDVVQAINYIKTTTSSEKVGYVGHSMGTTIMFYLAATQPDWVEQSISVFAAIAPVIMPINSTSQLI